MLKLKDLFKKYSKLNILSLGFIVPGIVCIIWAAIHILGQSAQSTNLKNHTVDQQTVTKKYEIDEENGKSDETNQDALESDQGEVEILYPVRPKKGDEIGTLIIPALEKEMTIFHGTDEEELKKGVGHYANSVLPGETDNSVLSGHRDTIFRDFGKLEVGDLFNVLTSAGQFTYEIKETRIVDQDDKTIIVPSDHAVLTVTTCYPFNYIGSAPDRYILSADLVRKE